MTATYTLVTGASDGIGAEFAMQLSRKDRNLILVARTESKMQQLKKTIAANGSKSKVEIIVQDLSEPGAAQKVFDACKSFKVSTLVNNAGRAIGGKWETHNPKMLRNFLALNVDSLTELTSLFLPQLMDFARKNPHSEEGGLLNVSSSSAFQPIPYMTTYAASKAFVLFLTEGLHEEMRTSCPEMRVTCLCPGPVDTAIWENAGGDASKVKLGWMPVESVVAGGLAALRANKSVYVPGWIPWLMSLSPRFSPRGITARLAGVFMGQKDAAVEMAAAAEGKTQK